MFRILGTFWLTILLFFGSVFAATLTIKPLYADSRFPPTDKLHAWCLQSADIVLATQLDIQELHVVMTFDPEKVDILRVIPSPNASDEIINSTIKYGEIHYDQTHMAYKPLRDMKVFGMAFHAWYSIDTIDFAFAPGSYLITKQGDRLELLWSVFLLFAPVTECDPDIVPPSVTLLKPSFNSTGGVPLDSLFVFSLKDVGKGIDFSSLSVTIDGDIYSISSPGVVVSGNYLIVQPKKWLPISSIVIVSLKVSDLQSYGWANLTQKIFKIVTPSSVLLEDTINPVILKEQSRVLRALQGSDDECRFLRSLASMKTDAIINPVNSLMNKLHCDLIVWVTGGVSTPLDHGSAPLGIFTDSKEFSLFALTWWGLFIVTFLLKLHYMYFYRKHKRLLSFLQLKP